ncbi:DUF1878 domain-containing protein [Pseudalkalibacillus hwajinpoensis]|uniref:DUF1878 domain-containing protein n=1 Tax=Guptibacillus hwajinpoensis TaxID=208199 RepID=A0A4U1MME6_9BACL|nr:DUF1878 domain-containing protein [Pseudalkalibacillus hwajinpoensis]TKD72117.1 DUF1878 domain-containing protein [Pseudalkalibacillus hwajinpoensis]
MKQGAMEKRIAELEETVDYLLFRQELLFSNTSIDRVLYEYGIKRDQYDRIITLMTDYEESIVERKPVNHYAFEQSIYHIIPEQAGNHQFAEYLTRVFWENDCCQNVFKELYAMELYSL